jgi:tRNA (cytidine32/uridine32-2'-O)-methyltransferase
MTIFNLRIVLVDTSHPGNIGATARAMKTMGLTQLYLVNPKKFPHVDASARAAGADDILAKATITDSLTAALKDCNLIFGTSARLRDLPLTLISPRAAAEKIYSNKKCEIAIIFGRENNGLTNYELSCCHYHIAIPTNPNFSSLNLAAAVQIIAYEIKMTDLSNSAILKNTNTIGTKEELATATDLELFYNHLQEALIETKFIDPAQPKKIMLRLKRLFNRTFLSKIEVNILRGILTAKQKPK